MRFEYTDVILKKKNSVKNGIHLAWLSDNSADNKLQYKLTNKISSVISEYKTCQHILINIIISQSYGNGKVRDRIAYFRCEKGKRFTIKSKSRNVINKICEARFREHQHSLNHPSSLSFQCSYILPFLLQELFL